MIISEVISDFKVLYDEKIATDAGGLENEEIQAYLDDAQNELVEKKVFGRQSMQQNFESSQEMISDLRNLIEHSSLTVSTGSNLNGFDHYAELPTGATGFRYYISSQSDVTRTKYPTVTGASFNNIFVGYSNIGNFASFGLKVHFLEPRVAIKDGKIYLKGDSFTTINDVDLEYIRESNPIRGATGSDEVDLPEHLRGELVTIAVTKAVAGMSDQNRYQIYSAEQQKESS